MNLPPVFDPPSPPDVCRGGGATSTNGIGDLHLERILCFKHLREVARDNTVKYQLRTPRLPSAQDRPGDAGVKV